MRCSERACKTAMKLLLKRASPINGLQIVNFPEMAIPGNQNHPVMSGCGGDPNVVLRYRPPFFLQSLPQKSVFARTSRSQTTIALPSANRSTFLLFSSGRADLAAPKNNSPSAMAGTNTSGARSRFDSTAGSPSSNAMMIFVSSRNLPLTGVNLLTLSLDRVNHLLSRSRIETAGELQQIRTLLSNR
jgi:hypothetical protein